MAIVRVVHDVSERLVRNELGRLEQAILARGLGPELVTRAARQYATGTGPWRVSRTLQHGVTTIVEDLEGWARHTEAKSRATLPPPVPAKSETKIRAAKPPADMLDRIKGAR